MQIHQDPVFDHTMAHADAEINLSAARAEFVTIQYIQADLEQNPSSKEDHDLKAPSTPTLDSQTFKDMIQEDRSLIYDKYVDTDWYDMEDALHSLCQAVQAVISPPPKPSDLTSGYTKGSHKHNSQGEANAEPYRNINGSSSAKDEATRGTV